MKPGGVLCTCVLILLPAATLLIGGCQTKRTYGERLKVAHPLAVPPPTDRIDPPTARPTRPSPSHEWIDGEWRWRDDWVWQPGRWSLRPHPEARWIEGHWAWRGGSWEWIDGYWSLPPE